MKQSPPARQRESNVPTGSRPSRWVAVLVAIAAIGSDPIRATEAPADSPLAPAFEREIRPLLQRYCHHCHSGETVEAEIDFSRFATYPDVVRHPKTWQKVREMLESGQMPPTDAPQPSADDHGKLQHWVREHLTTLARLRAGDPGAVVLRRLSNAEYTYTVRDLTGVDALDPAREFPVDGAAGEWFTNVGGALVVSPSLLVKYLDAAKGIADHAVLLPDGMRFSPHASRRDWTNECLDQIREFYGEFTDSAGGDVVNLQGIIFKTNEGGRIPLDRYLTALVESREAILSGRIKLDDIARERKLSPRYLAMLWDRLISADAPTPSLLIDVVRSRLRETKGSEVGETVGLIAGWQQALWKFNPVGHIGRQGGPTAWMEPINPIVERQEFRIKLPPSPSAGDVVLTLSAGDAGDGGEQDDVLWERPRLVAPGRPDLLLRDVRRVIQELSHRRQILFASVDRCLAAADEASTDPANVDVAQLAQKHAVDPLSLGAWLEYLGIGADRATRLETPIDRKMASASGYDFIRGWVGDDALSVVANSSDEHVRIPGNMKPNGVAVHPAPTQAVGVAWRCPMGSALRVEGKIQHAHPECGNGVAWTLELRRGRTRQTLAKGTSHGGAVVPIGPVENLAVLAGDVVALVVDPRDGNHSCDLTAIDLTLRAGDREWDLAGDVSPDILAGNPHPDRVGNPEVWYFFREPVGGTPGPVIPAGSLLANWQSARDPGEKRKFALALRKLLQAGAEGTRPDAPDAVLVRQLNSLGGPLLSVAMRAIEQPAATVGRPLESPYGLEGSRFGRHADGGAIEPASLCVRAPSRLEIRLPAELVAGSEFVTAGALEPRTGAEGTVQLSVSTAEAGSPASAESRLVPGLTVLVAPASAARKRVESALDDFRQCFPAALCYTKIVPVDEVVTLTLFHREDDHLKRLMLDEEQSARLDRLWDEMHFVSQDALTLVNAHEQLVEFATQDRQDLVPVFESMRQPILDRASAFRQRLVASEPAQVDAVLAFADRAYRRPLTDAESNKIRDFHSDLRQKEIPHDEAVRLTIARVLVAPAFLYRAEQPVPGSGQGPISSLELATRLSFFLWSSQPDGALREVAEKGHLQESKVLVDQARRMLRDPKARRLATEFACQWLHIHGFDAHDEKSESVFPTFAGLRGAMYEEAIQFFTDFFQNDRPVRNLLEANYTFLDEALAEHYGIPGVTGPRWRRVDGVDRFGRGGILALSATLARQSGASRTSPILRGNWLCEVVLGEKLPRPPKNVPVLDDVVPQGLTERQLIQRHGSDPACARCHVRIDPYGFAMENYDAIGRYRQNDSQGLPIDAMAVLPDGTTIDGVAGLRRYLATQRRDDFLRQFHRKMLGYALGRAIQLSDEPLLEQLQQVSLSPDDRVGRVVESIVLSRQFREIRGQESSQEE